MITAEQAHKLASTVEKKMKEQPIGTALNVIENKILETSASGEYNVEVDIPKGTPTRNLILTLTLLKYSVSYDENIRSKWRISWKNYLLH